MKRFFLYNLFTVILLLGVTVVSTTVWEKSLTSKTYPLNSINNEIPADPLEKTFFFTVHDSPAIPAGLTKISNPRVPVSIIRTGHNPYGILKFYFSQITQNQLYTTGYTFVSHYSKKEYDGYYIYTLRKLLI